MMLTKSRNRWRVLLEPQGQLDTECLGDWDSSTVAKWLDANTQHGWKGRIGCEKLKGDNRAFTAIFFYDEAEALLFKMSFSERPIEPNGAVSDFQTGRPIGAAELLRIKADPSQYKATLIFEGSPNWRYRDTGKERYCHSVGRNVAGYFVGWRMVDDNISQIRASKTKKVILAWVDARAAA